MTPAEILEDRRLDGLVLADQGRRDENMPLGCQGRHGWSIRCCLCSKEVGAQHDAFHGYRKRDGRAYRVTSFWFRGRTAAQSYADTVGKQVFEGPLKLTPVEPDEVSLWRVDRLDSEVTP